MTYLQRRLERLESMSAQHNAPPWPAVDAALTRQTARVRLVLCERLETEDDHYAIVAARETLGEDTPEQAAADLDVINRWHRVHGLREDSDVRQRLMLRPQGL